MRTSRKMRKRDDKKARQPYRQMDLPDLRAIKAGRGESYKEY